MISTLWNFAVLSVKIRLMKSLQFWLYLSILSSEIKLCFTVQKISQFICRPRHCSKCFKFNHPNIKWKSVQLCVTCGIQHEGICSSVKCVNYVGEHRADFDQCSHRIQETEFLKFKCRNFLSFVEARRIFFFFKSEISTYSNITKGKKRIQRRFRRYLRIELITCLKCW